MRELIDRFDEVYTFLYDHADDVPGYDEAVRLFDALNDTFIGQKLIYEFVKRGGDFIASDREAAAFTFTILSMIDKGVLK